MADTNVTLTLAMRDEDFKRKVESIKENIGNIRSNKEEQIKEFSENIDESLKNGKLMQTNALISNTQKFNTALDVLSDRTNKFVKDTVDDKANSVRRIVVNNVLSSIEDLKENMSSKVLESQLGGNIKNIKFKIKYSI